MAIRIKGDIDDLLDKISKDLSISKSGFVKHIIENALISNDFGSKLSIELKRKISIVMIRTSRTEITSRLYIIKNMYQRIYDMAMSFYFTTGMINMKVINKILDMFVEEFKYYPKKDKDILKVDFEMAVANLRHEDYIIEHTDKIKMLMDRRK